jgi:hypothetical protein
MQPSRPVRCSLKLYGGSRARANSTPRLDIRSEVYRNSDGHRLRKARQAGEEVAEDLEEDR